VNLLHFRGEFVPVKTRVGSHKQTAHIKNEFLTIALVVDLTDNLGDEGEVFAGEV
jgi:hypothetical protein